MLRHTLTIGAALAAVALAPAGASAADFTRTYDVTAADFEGVFAPGFGPTQLFAASYTVAFDPGADVAPTTKGLTVNFDSLADPTEYAYAKSDDTLALGSMVVSGNAIDTSDGEYGLFIDGATSATPTIDEVFYQTGKTFYASNIQSVTILATSAAPEPAAWAMMLVGVGLAGVALRSRRTRVCTTAARRILSAPAA